MLPRRGTPRLYDLVKLHSDTPSTVNIIKMKFLQPFPHLFHQCYLQAFVFDFQPLHLL